MPSDGVLTISGDIGSDGKFTGVMHTGASGPDHQDRGRSSVALSEFSVSGNIDADIATGVFTTSRCRTTFHLTRIAPTLLP